MTTCKKSEKPSVDADQSASKKAPAKSRSTRTQKLLDDSATVSVEATKPDLGEAPAPKKRRSSKTASVPSSAEVEAPMADAVTEPVESVSVAAPKKRRSSKTASVPSSAEVDAPMADAVTEPVESVSVAAPKKRRSSKTASVPSSSEVDAPVIENEAPLTEQVVEEPALVADMASCISTDIMSVEDIDDACQLSQCLRVIQDNALYVHERFEKRHIPVARLFESLICGAHGRYEESVLWSAIWNFTLFTRARLVCQQNFQDQVVASLPDSAHAFIMRQMLCTPPRVWSYRRSYQRSFAHPINGPVKTQEISLNGCMMSYGLVNEAAHIYAFGWTITFHDKTWLICAAELTRQQAFTVESIHPYPLYRRDDLFWEEQFVTILQSIYQPISLLNKDNLSPMPSLTGYSPESLFQNVQRLVSRQASVLSPDVLHGSGNLHDIVATSDASAIVQEAVSVVHRFTSTGCEALLPRLLDAYGCDEHGEMTQLLPSVVANDPIALLLLPEDHPIFQYVHPRDAIKAALAAEQQQLAGSHDVRDAFNQYMIERRWLHSYTAFDLNDENHAAVVNMPIESVRHVFDPRIFDTHLSLVPQGDYINQFREKFGFFTNEDELPTFRELLDALMSRKILRAAAIAPLSTWFFQVCETWRYNVAEIETTTQPARRNTDQNAQKMLSSGLKGLAAMFKKKK